jgi:ankyrin repeat protein
LRGNRSMLDLLLKLNGHSDDLAQVSARDKLGCSIIHLAAIGNCLELMEKVADFDNNIDAVDNEGWTALHWTAYFGHQKAASILVDHGASLDCRNKQGWTPYQLSVISRSQHVTGVISGGNVSSKDAIGELSEDIKGVCNSCYRVSILSTYTRKHCEHRLHRDCSLT